MSRHPATSAAHRHVLMISAHFAPENVSGTHRPLHFARSLAEAGIGVDVVTVTTDRLQTVDAALLEVFPFSAAVHRIPATRTLGEIYLAMARRRRRAQSRGTAALAEGQIPSPRSASRSSMRSLLAQLDVFPDPYASWRRPATRAAVAIGRERQTDLVFASGPPWTALRVGAATAARLRVPFIADFRDPWTPLTGASSLLDFQLLRILAARWERSVVERADRLVFNSAAVAEAAASGYPCVEEERRRVILNGSDAPRREVGAAIPRDAPVRLRHFGTLYQGRSLDPLLGALKGGAVGPVDLELYGVSEWRAPATVPAGVAITAHGTLTHADAIERMREPAVLVLVQPAHFDRQIPTKLFEYLCTGNPVLVIGSRESAAWELASRYERCRLLEYGAEPLHSDVVAGLVARWREGLLRQEVTASDTSHFTKASVGQEFVNLVEELVKP